MLDLTCLPDPGLNVLAIPAHELDPGSAHPGPGLGWGELVQSSMFQRDPGAGADRLEANLDLGLDVWRDVEGSVGDDQTLTGLPDADPAELEAFPAGRIPHFDPSSTDPRLEPDPHGSGGICPTVGAPSVPGP